jgi:DNA primase large subunit
LRRRFVKAETALFRVKYESDDARERELFLKSRDFQWNEVLNDNTNSPLALTVSLGST